MESRKLPFKNTGRKVDRRNEDYRICNLHDYSVDVDTRKIYITDEIEGYSCQEIVKNFHYLESLDSKKPIYIYVNSPGGSVDQMFFVYDAIKNLKCPAITIGTGGIYSAAGLILVSGDLRLATNNAFFMAHQMQNLIVGSDNEIEAQVAIGRKMRDRFWNIMGKHTNIDERSWKTRAQNKGEIWYTAEEMLQNKIVDSLLKPGQAAEDAANEFEIDVSKRIS